MRLFTFGFAAILALGGIGCGDDGDGDDGTNQPDGGAGGPDGGSGGPDGGQGVADAGPGATRIIEAEYTIPDGSEFYQCARITASEDLWIKKITPVNGAGTHHLVLGIDPTPGPEGTGPCSASEVAGYNVLFASGVGSPSLSMPEGVALLVPKGQQMVLNVHLFNTTDVPISSSAAIDVELSPPVAPEMTAEVILAGNVMFSIPPGDNQVVNGRCTMSGNTNFFAVFPHMHQLGKHIKIWARKGGTDMVVYDSPYQFEEQEFASFTPIPLANGDQIRVECTYNNTTGSTVTFGDSSNQEMCFAISYRYPKLGNGPFGSICTI